MTPLTVLRAATAILQGLAGALLVTGALWYLLHLIARWIGNP